MAFTFEDTVYLSGASREELFEIGTRIGTPKQRQRGEGSVIPLAMGSSRLQVDEKGDHLGPKSKLKLCIDLPLPDKLRCMSGKVGEFLPDEKVILEFSKFMVAHSETTLTMFDAEEDVTGVHYESTTSLGPAALAFSGMIEDEFIGAAPGFIDDYVGAISSVNPLVHVVEFEAVTAPDIAVASRAAA